MKTMVAVPKSMLDELEHSRVKLYELFPDITNDEVIRLTNITAIMWKLANTNWKEIES